MSDLQNKERCHDCGRFLSFADLCFSKHHFVPLNEFGPEESWFSCPACRDDYGGRDSGSGPKGEDAPAAECEASQSGDAEGSASPNPLLSGDSPNG